MTITGDMIDHATLDGHLMYAATEDSIFKTTDVRAEVVTWTKVFDATNDDHWDQSLGELILVQLRQGTDILYAIGFVSGGDGTAVTYIVRTEDGGTSWISNEIKSITSAISDFRVDTKYTYADLDSAATCGNITTWEPPESSELYQPWAVSIQAPGCYDLGALNPRNKTAIDYREAIVPCWFTPFPDFDTLITGNSLIGTNYGETTPVVSINDRLTVAQKLVMVEYLDYHYGAGKYRIASYIDMDTDPTKIHIAHIMEGTTVDVVERFNIIAQVFWHTPTPSIVFTFDIGKHNTSVVYVGLESEILVSRNKGDDWETYSSEVGANDIECYLAQDSEDLNITVWTTTGLLYRIENGVLGSAYLDTETPCPVPYRIASDPVTSFPIFTLSHTGGNLYDLTKMDGSSGTVMQTGLSEARSIVFSMADTPVDRAIYYLSIEDIHYSPDLGVTVELKKGAWDTYSNHLRIFPLES